MRRYLLTTLLLLLSASAMAQIEVVRPTPTEQSEMSVQNTPSSVAVEPAKEEVRLPLSERLGSPLQIDSVTTINATVRFEAKGDAEQIVAKGLYEEPKSVNGYRIVIFMNNTQSARRDALAVQESFAQLYPTESSYLSYDNPYFKVTVGNYSSQEEATILLGKIRRSFPKAFIMRESIPTVEFTK